MTKTRNVYFNPNPMKHEVGDCSVRACCVATGKSWDEVYRALCDIGFELKRMPTAQFSPAWTRFWHRHFQGFGYKR